jgi:hypothetical protein
MTRRSFLDKAATATVAAAVCGTSRGLSQVSPPKVLQLLKEYKNTVVKDTSSDGRYLLVWLVGTPVQRFRIPSRAAPEAQSVGSLALIDRTTGRTTNDVPLESFARPAFLLRDISGAIYRQSTAAGGRWLLWSFGDGAVRDLCPSKVNRETDFLALDNAGYVISCSRSMDEGTYILQKMDRNTCTQVAATSSDVAVRTTMIQDFSVSAAGRVLAYIASLKKNAKRSFSEHIVIRKTADLSLQQTLQAPDGWKFIRFVFSHDESKLVARCSRNNELGDVEPQVVVYEVASGKVMQRIAVPSDGHEIAVSSDDRLFAVSSKAKRHAKGEVMQAQACVFEMASGELAGVGAFPELRQPRNNPWVSDIGKLVFSSAADELLASTYDTRVWRI